jgi:hypothetical protein
MSWNIISAMAHDDAICRDVEKALNRLIDTVKESGGKCWLQSKENKEHYYELTDHVSLCFYVFTNQSMQEKKIE